jgi:hypothetical protein
MRWTVPTPTPNVEAIWRSPGLFFLLSAAWKARSVLSAWNLAAILLIAAISLIVMSSITPPTQQTYWRNFSNRPIEVAADEPRDLRRDVPEQRRYHTTAGMVAIGHSRYHYFGRFTYAAARCKSIFGNADIAAVVVER